MGSAVKLCALDRHRYDFFFLSLLAPLIVKISCFETTAWLPNTTPLDVPYAFYLHIYARDYQSPHH